MLEHCVNIVSFYNAKLNEEAYLTRICLILYINTSEVDVLIKKYRAGIERRTNESPVNGIETYNVIETYGNDITTKRANHRLLLKKKKKTAVEMMSMQRLE